MVIYCHEKYLKNKKNFKSDLVKTRKGVIQNVKNFFDLREKIVNFFRDIFYLLSEAK